MTTVEEGAVRLDTTEVDKYLGQPMGGGQLREPVSVTDIRRWAQGMQYPNPLHYDEEYAAKTVFGGIVAPQSFTICCDVGHGATPAIVGNIPGTHMIFGGDEWWFYGARVYPGDKLHMRRRFVDYKISDTKFAGPTMFSRGETIYLDERDEPVAKQWSTAVRYLAEEARKRGFFFESAPKPQWTPAQLDEWQTRRLTWIRTRRGAEPRRWDDVAEGEKLPQRPIGPHTVATFATEWRSYIFTVWGTSYREGWDQIAEAGWLAEMDRDLATAAEDPSLGDGLYRGPSSGHTDDERAHLIGMPRGYGYGASMGAWVLDYVSYWAGDQAFVRHSAVQYRFPPFEGDVSLLDGTVVDKRRDETLGVPIVVIDFVMTNQDGSVLAKGPVEVQLPE